MGRALAAAATLLGGVSCPAALAADVPPGEAMLAGPAQVRTAAGAPAGQLEQGRTVTVLGYPRGTSSAWVAIGGVEVGYVDKGLLLPPWGPRPVLYRATVVAAGTAPGGDQYLLPAARQAAGGKAVLATLVGAGGGKARLHARSAFSADPDQVSPVVGTYEPGQIAPGAAAFYLARLGSHVTASAAHQAWAELVAAMPHVAAAHPHVYKRAGGDGVRFELAAGPYDEEGVDRACALLANAGRDCWKVAVDAR